MATLIVILGIILVEKLGRITSFYKELLFLYQTVAYLPAYTFDRYSKQLFNKESR